MRALAQFSSASLLGTLLAGLVITGLLHFPSSCTCGAQLPHTHSLFQLAGHHHDYRAHAGGAQTGAAALNRTGPMPDGPIVVQSGNSEVKIGFFITAASGAGGVAGRPLRRRRPANQATTNGLIVTPEPGPPKRPRRAAATTGRISA